MLVGDSMMHICRQLLGGFKSLCEFQIATHYETLVQLHQICDPVIYEQIVANRHFRCRQSGTQKTKIQKRGVEHDIAVIGYKRKRLLGIHIAYSSDTNSGCGLSGKHLKERPHYL